MPAPIRFTLAAAGLACTLAALPAAAATVHVAGHISGSITFVSDSPQVTDLPGGRKVMTVPSYGVVLLKDAASPINLSSVDCTGAYVLDPQGNLTFESGSCNMIDRDGDTWSLWYSNRGKTRVWNVIGGTGKYAHLTGGGTDTEQDTIVDGRVVLNIEGDLKE